MKVKGIVWLGTRTKSFEPMRSFCVDALGMTPVYDEDQFAVLDLPNGDRFEIFGDEYPENTFIEYPIAGFLVDDIFTARAELEARGISFIGPIHKIESGYAWSDFRAPDGFIYELAYNPGHPTD
jgi:catechol 2,3-dioxygenase-like lactoylglutathione lyase family enzyme